MAYQPKSYRKFVATAATATLVASAVTPVFAAETGAAATFTDVPARYTAAVEFLLENQITNGLTETQYGTTLSIKRVDAAVMIAKALNLDLSDRPASGFGDVPARAAVYVDALKAEGIINGKTATSFGAEDNITRGEIALIFAKAFNLTGTATHTFTDVSARYNVAVQALVEAGITQGKTATSFGTADAITRGEFAIFVHRAKTPESPATAIQSVVASNGTVTATFNEAPATAPVASDFVVTSSVNGGAATTVTPTNFNYNSTTKSVTFSVPEVAQTNAAQTVTYSVKYKQEAAVSGSFTLAAVPVSSIQAVGYDVAAQQVTLIFDRPVNEATAETLANYTYDTNRNSTTDTPVYPTAVTLETSATGTIEAGRIVNLTFPAGTLALNQQGALTVQNVTDTQGNTIATTTRNVNVTTAAADAGAPTFTGATDVTLRSGVQTVNAGGTLTIARGTNPTLNVEVTDANTIAKVEYRTVAPNGVASDWTNLNAFDGVYDETSETATGVINTATFTPGSYGIQIRTYDALGNVTATPATNITLAVQGGDVTVPTVGATATYNPAATATAAARTVTVTGTAVDSNADGIITNVQYRVRSYNATTNTYTTVSDWTSGTATDGSFNENSESYTLTTPQLAAGSSYIVEVRSVDNAGNFSTVSPATLATGGPISQVGGSATVGTFAIANDTAAPVVTATATTPATLGTTAAPVRTRALVITGTATDTVNAAGGTDGAAVARVEYAIYRDSDNNGSFDQEVQAYTTTGVIATEADGFNDASEAYTINTTLPEQSGTYRVLVRAVDASGNVGAAAAPIDNVLDVERPTATVTANTATASTFDFVVTYSEAVDTAEATRAANYLVRNANGDIVATAATNVTAASTLATNRQYIVEFGTSASPNAAIVTGNTLEIVNVDDVAGNVINPNPTTFTIVNDNR